MCFIFFLSHIAQSHFQVVSTIKLGIFDIIFLVKYRKKKNFVSHYVLALFCAAEQRVSVLMLRSEKVKVTKATW